MNTELGNETDDSTQETTIPLQITRAQINDALTCLGLDPRHAYSVTVLPGVVRVELAMPGRTGAGSLAIAVVP